MVDFQQKEREGCNYGAPKTRPSDTLRFPWEFVLSCDKKVRERMSDWTRTERVFVAVCMLAMFLMMAMSVQRLSPTFDEPVHVVSGLALLQQRDARLNPEHPPLMKVLAALPLIRSVHPDYNDRYFCAYYPCQWTFSESQLETSQLQDRIFRARLPLLLVTLLLGFTLYVAARRIGRPSGGMLALVVYVTSPFFLGYGPLVDNDVLLAFMVLCICMTAADLVEEPSRKTMWLMALALAGAFLSKLTSVLILPVLLLCWMWELWCRYRHDRQGALKFSRYWFTSILLSFVFTYLFYFWFGGATPATQILAERQLEWHNQTQQHFFSLTNGFVEYLAAHPGVELALRPLWLYLTGIFCILGRGFDPGYVLGQSAGVNAVDYYPVAFLFKMPLTLLAMLTLLLITCSLLLKKSGWRCCLNCVQGSQHPFVRLLLATFVFFTAVSVFSGIHIGIRHISVTILIVHVLVSWVPDSLRLLDPGLPAKFFKYFTFIIAAAGLWTGLASYPNYIAYFNPLHGNTPKQEIVNNSNLEWGQGLILLADYQRQQGLHHLYIHINTSVDPKLYLPDASGWFCQHPIPDDAEWLAVSASFMLNNAPGCKHLYSKQTI